MARRAAIIRCSRQGRTMTDVHHIRRDSGGLPLLIHGLGGNTHSFDTIVDALAAQREVIAIDLPGFGQTPALDGEISIRTMSDAVTQFLQAHGLTGIDAGRVPTRCARRLDQATAGDRLGPAGPRVLAEPGRTGEPAVSRCASALVRALRALPALGFARRNGAADPGDGRGRERRGFVHGRWRECRSLMHAQADLKFQYGHTHALPFGAPPSREIECPFPCTTPPSRS